MTKKIISLLTVGDVTLSSVGVFSFDINETYDDTKYTNSCDTEISGLTLGDDEPDGSKYYTLEEGSSEFKNISGLNIESEKWYHIQIMGQYGTSKALSMEVFEWDNGSVTISSCHMVCFVISVENGITTLFLDCFLLL